MPNYTDNYNLIKPKKEENYDVNETTNNNMDIIDSELYKRVQKVPGKGLSSNDFTNEYIKKINQMGEAKRGFTFTPSVSEEGIISWENDGELENPAPVNIKGPQGAIGPQGPQGIQGEQGVQGVQGPQGLTGPANNITIGTVTKGDEAQASITGQAPNQILNLTLPKGDKGNDGAQGEKGETGATGPANILSIGTVNSGEIASATITGNAPNQTLNLTLPRGEKGDKGDKGDSGEISETVLFEGDADSGYFLNNIDLTQYKYIDIYILSYDETSNVQRVERIKKVSSNFSDTIQFGYIYSSGYTFIIGIQFSDNDMSITTNGYFILPSLSFKTDKKMRVVKVVGIS